MSHVTLHAVPREGEIFVLEEYPNAFLGAMKLWTHLADKYGIELSIARPETFQAVWDLADDESVPTKYRDVLLSTLDGAIVRVEDVPRLAESMDWVGLRMRVSHYDEMSWDLLEVYDARDRAESDLVGVCWTQTSSVAPWDRTGEDGGSRPFDFSRDYGREGDPSWLVDFPESKNQDQGNQGGEG